MCHAAPALPVFCSNNTVLFRGTPSGRVRPGHCYKLYTEHQWQKLGAHQVPEIKRVPIEQLCLAIKDMGLESVASFLAGMIDPPKAENISAALHMLQSINATDKEEHITPLGHHLASIPVDLRIGKFLIFGSLLRCLDPVLTIAAIMVGFWVRWDRVRRLTHRYLPPCDLCLAELPLAFSITPSAAGRGQCSQAAFCE